MSALQRIETIREAMNVALASRDWGVIGDLDMACRAELDEIVQAPGQDEGAVKDNLQALLDLYRQLIQVASDERQLLVDEMSTISQAKNAAKVYHLFS